MRRPELRRSGVIFRVTGATPSTLPFQSTRAPVGSVIISISMGWGTASARRVMGSGCGVEQDARRRAESRAVNVFFAFINSLITTNYPPPPTHLAAGAFE